ncbi:MAG TPA: tubulin-like doman-containing protein [Thermoanaerobaculia bacterium]|jgi:hypothetical protein
MSLDQVLQASLPARRESDKPVGPTLMIGLGGTGKEVLLRLRRRIVERYGSLSRLPFLRFMHVDTDTTVAAHEQYDLRGSDDPLYEEVRFNPIERIDLTIDGGTGKYVEHINNFPHIKRWFPVGGKTAALGNLGAGAGQVRLASRLGFFHADNFARISSRLEQCKGQLRDAAILQRSSELGFNFNADSMTVVIIASLAGGTGSGTFLDMGFLLQRYFPNADRIGILLLPGFFTDYAGGERVRANGYAALMELNHYSFGHSFVADWDGRRAELLPPPPFSNTYLIDGQNEAGLVIGSAGKEYDAYRMVAEVLFQDYSIGEFAGMKRATRINLENFNLNVYTHNFLNDALRRTGRDTDKNIVGDTYPTRFGSFGLATIAFPTERVQSACASRLAMKIVEHWQQSAIDDPLERLFTTFLTDEDVQGAQGRYERRDGGGVIERRDIEDALMVYDAGGGKTFASFLWQKAQTARSDIEAAPNGEKAQRLAERRAEFDVFLAKEDSEDPEEWGVGVRQIENNMRAYLARVKAGIEQSASELSDNPYYGVNYTLSLLRELKSLMRNENFWYAPYFDAQIPSWRDAVQYYGHALDQLQADVGRHEKEHIFRAADLRRDYEKLVGDDGDEDLGAFYNHFLARVRKQVAKRGRQICDEIDAFLGPDSPSGDGLLGRYYELLVGFEKLKERLRAKERYFSKPEKSELILSLYRDGDVDTWYREWVGESTQEALTLKILGSRILTEIFDAKSVTEVLAHIQRTPAEVVEARILEQCRQFIAGRKKQPEALALLGDASRFTPRQREEMVRQAYRLSKVWLARGERGLEHTGLPPVRSDQRPCLIGVDVSSFPRLEEFKKLVGQIQSPGDTPPSFQNIGEQHRGMIVFYHELAGVPAFYPSSVTAPRGLRAAYDAYPEKEDLHTDKNRFQFGDLIPKQTAEARQYADSLQAFVLARVLGLLQVREVRNEGEHPTFRYSYTRVDKLVADYVDLGDESHAVDFLYRDRRAEHLTDRRILLQMIEKAIQTLRGERKLMIYRLLLEFYLKKVYPPHAVTGVGIPDLTVTQYSPEYAVLHEARSRLGAAIGDTAEQEQFRNALRLLARKDLDKGEELSYEEFRDALLPYCKNAGKLRERRTDAVVYEETEWRDVLALDMAKIVKSETKTPAAPAPRSAAPAADAEKRFGERPCPKCDKPIDRRAAFCIHCRQTIAAHIDCPHCQEPRVPDDLELCWKCGQRMRQEEQIDCPSCFSWRGYESQFPCQNCGFDPNVEATAVLPPAMSPAAPPVAGPRMLTVADPAPPTAAVADPPLAVAVAAPVQCPICYSQVDAGPRCSICNALLQNA